MFYSDAMKIKSFYKLLGVIRKYPICEFSERDYDLKRGIAYFYEQDNSLVFNTNYLKKISKLDLTIIKKIIINKIKKSTCKNISIYTVLSNQEALGAILENKNFETIALKSLPKKASENISKSSLSNVFINELLGREYHEIINKNNMINVDYVTLIFDSINDFSCKGVLKNETIYVSVIPSVTGIECRQRVLSYRNINISSQFAADTINLRKALVEIISNMRGKRIYFPNACDIDKNVITNLINEEIILALLENKNIQEIDFGGIDVPEKFNEILFNSHLNKIKTKNYDITQYISQKCNELCIEKDKLNNLCGQNFMEDFKNGLFGDKNISIEGIYNEDDIKLLAKVIKTFVNDRKVTLSFEKKDQMELFLKYFSEERIHFYIAYGDLRDFTDEQLTLINKYRNLYSGDYKPDFIYKDKPSILPFKNVIEAKKIVKEIAKEINEPTLKLSSMEKYIWAYSIVKLFKKYEDVPKDTDLSIDEKENFPRKIEYILFNDKMVCVGYAELLAEIVAELNDPNLFVVPYDCAVDSNQKNHRRCIVCLKDEKCNVNGIFKADPTFDSLQNYGQNDMQYEHLIIEDEELNELKNMLEKEMFENKYKNLEILWDLKGKIENFKNFKNIGVSNLTILKAISEVYSKIYLISSEAKELEDIWSYSDTVPDSQAELKKKIANKCIEEKHYNDIYSSSALENIVYEASEKNSTKR